MDLRPQAGPRVTVLAQLIALVRALPLELLDRLERWARALHGPYDVLGDGSVAICRYCDVEWPCSAFTELDDSIRARAAAEVVR